MKKKPKSSVDRVRIVWSVFLIICIFFAAVSVTRLLRVWPKDSAEEKLMQSVARQGEWFTRNQTEDGDFFYERIAATGVVKNGNNIVRQAGALYGLGQLYHYNQDPTIKKSLERGFDYFRGITSTPSADVNAIVYDDDTQSNTVALLVLGLVEYLETDEGHRTTQNMEYLVRLSNYLVATQAVNGAYINDYTPRAVESDYNNGETMYALIRSYNLTQREIYLTSVKRFANYAMTHYGKEGFNSSFFSWGMAGFAYLYNAAPEDGYWDFLKAYADKYMAGRGNRYEQYLTKKSTSAIPPGSSVFLEGVDHIAWIAKDKDQVLYVKLRDHVKKVLEHLMLYEIGSPYGKFTATNDLVRGAICSQVTCETTRIDFLQHNMSAILLYMRLVR